MTDEETVTRILNGETRLYEQLIRKYNQQLYRISRAIINDGTDAEDIMQITYLNAFRQLANFRQQSSFSTWLTRILINESLLHKKRKQSAEKRLMETNYNDRHNDTPLDDLMKKELGLLIEKAVSALPEKYRIVFVMREVQGLSTDETMQALNIGESNVKIRLSRAKDMLRKELSNYWQPQQLFEFNLVRCDSVVSYVMSKIYQSLN